MCDYFKYTTTVMFAAINYPFSFDVGAFLAGSDYCKTCPARGTPPTQASH